MLEFYLFSFYNALIISIILFYFFANDKTYRLVKGLLRKSHSILPFWICFNKSKNDERPIKPLQFSLAQKCLSKNRSFKIEFLSQRSLMPARVSFEVAKGICPLLLTLIPYPDYNRIIGAWHLWTVMSKSVLLWRYLELN